MTLRFLLVCEGSADAGLIQHIRMLLVHLGQTDPEGAHWTRGRSLTDKIRGGLENFGGCELLFVHRDADAYQNTDAAGPLTRYNEVRKAICDVGYTGAWVSIIPVRMMETWLLLDESAIRRVAGRPRGSEPLDLPLPAQVEHESDPKGRLYQALETASRTRGRRLRIFRRDLPHYCRQLLDGLPITGPLEQVPSWVRFRDDLIKSLTTLGNA